MNTLFMNSENSKTSEPHRPLLNLTYKIDLRRKDKHIALSNLVRYLLYLEKYKRILKLRTINLKFRLQHRMKNLNYLMDHILYQRFKIILNIY